MTPDSVRAAALGAAEIIWVDPAGAADRLRVAVEELLTEQRVNKTFVTKRGKRERVKTHDRIELFRQRKPDAAEVLMAVKWIGNTARTSRGSPPRTSWKARRCSATHCT